MNAMNVQLFIHLFLGTDVNFHNCYHLVLESGLLTVGSISLLDFSF